ncbi:MAG: hypothetical protein ABIH66_12960 [bacterium]
MEKPKQKEPRFPAVSLSGVESTEKLLSRFIEAENSQIERITRLIDRSREALERSRIILGRVPLKD